MEPHVIGGLARDIAALVWTGQGAAAHRPGECDGAAAGHGAPWITDSGGAGEAGGQQRNPMATVVV
jgi:hypothetical protein